MNLRRTIALFLKDLIYGPKNFLFIFALVVPIVLSLAVTLLFGSLFSGRPQLGLVDAGQSQVGTLVAEQSFVEVRAYNDRDALHAAVERGEADMGLVLPVGFDEALREEGPGPELGLLVWGQSLLRDRAILVTALGEAIVSASGRDMPVEVTTTTLGETAAAPWYERLLPFLVLMAVIMGGSMVPATALIEEKQKGTLTAVTVTPATLGELFAAKALLGILLSLTVGVVTLLLNQAFGVRPGLLLLILGMAAVFAGLFGLVLGGLVRDINTLFAVVKAIGILLYAPALLYLFPDLPGWISRIFPTYYITNPLLTITQEGGGFADIAADLAILAGFILLLLAAVAIIIRRLERE